MCRVVTQEKNQTWRWFPSSKECWSFPVASSHFQLMLVEPSEQHYAHDIIPDSELNHQSWMLEEYNRAIQPLSQEDS